MLKHQNRKEMLFIADVFTEQGFNIDVIRFNKKIDANNFKNYDLIFGLEPNFEKICKENPKSKKIYYATGAYYKHQNYVIKNRTDKFNNKNNSHLEYKRMIKEHNSVRLADKIIQIGNKHTIETYPEKFRNKIITIRQTGYKFNNFDLAIKKQKFSSKNYLWFAGKGNILKGLDLVIDFFLKNDNLNLFIVGDLDKSFKHYYFNKIKKSKNIFYKGFLPINSNELINLAYECSFVVLPSSSEGMPGSIINMMKLGLIPIVSKYASCVNEKATEIIINNICAEGLKEAIYKSQRFDKDELIKSFKTNHKFASENFNEDTFQNDFKKALNNC